MKDNDKEQIFNDLQVSFNVCREVVLSQLNKFRRPGEVGVNKLAGSLMLTYDMIVRSAKEQGNKPIPEAGQIRIDTVEKLKGFIREYDKGQLSKIETSTKIAGAMVESGLKAFGSETHFFINSLN